MNFLTIINLYRNHQFWGILDLDSAIIQNTTISMQQRSDIEVYWNHSNDHHSIKGPYSTKNKIPPF